MTVVSSDNFIDHDTGKKVSKIIEKYMDTELSEETCDLVLADIREAFGQDHFAEVSVDTDTSEIAVIIEDKNNRLLKCTSLQILETKNDQ
jgi:hypothetical protein